MEFAPEGDLDGLVRRTRDAGGRLGEGALWEYVAQLTLGLGHLHANKVGGGGVAAARRGRGFAAGCAGGGGVGWDGGDCRAV